MRFAAPSVGLARMRSWFTKGRVSARAWLKKCERSGTPLINVFPDYSPHAYGRHVQEAIGCYDLIISTKPYHPQLWRSVYGYRNPCVFVPHGYDPGVHYWADPSPAQLYDVALCCTWRLEYHRLMRSFADPLGDESLAIGLAGSGWAAHRDQLPRHWHYVGPRIGRAYGEFLRSAKIAVAPVNREVVIRGIKQPGDEDTTRTYELASAHCFSCTNAPTMLPLFMTSKTRYRSGMMQLSLPGWCGDGYRMRRDAG